MNKNYPIKHAFTTGTCVAGFGPVFFAIADKISNTPTHFTNPMTIRGVTGLLSLIILGVGIYYGMQSVKKLNGGALSYGAAIKTGLFISVITGIITAAFTFIYCQYIDKDFAGHIISESIALLIAEHASAEEISRTINDITRQLSTSMQVMQALVGQPVSGLILSLIIGAFVKTKKQP